MASSSDPQSPKKIVLAYSGGLDTSVIFPGSRTAIRHQAGRLRRRTGSGDELKGIEDKA